MTEYFPECTTNTLAALGEGMSSRSDELRLAFARKALEIERELPDSGQDAEDDSGFNELVEALWRKAHEITTRDQLCTVDYLFTTESTSLSYAETSECTLRGPTRVHDAAHPRDVLHTSKQGGNDETKMRRLKVSAGLLQRGPEQSPRWNKL